MMLASMTVILCYFVSCFKHICLMLFTCFPTCQVRVARFYVSCLLLPACLPASCLPASCVLPPPPASFSSSSSTAIHSVSAGPQPRSSTSSVPCQTSTANIHAQCSLPDLNRDHPRPVFPAGPQPRPSPPSVPCRTSTATIPAQCSLPDLNRSIHAKCSLPDLM